MKTKTKAKTKIESESPKTATESFKWDVRVILITERTLFLHAETRQIAPDLLEVDIITIDEKMVYGPLVNINSYHESSRIHTIHFRVSCPEALDGLSTAEIVSTLAGHLFNVPLDKVRATESIEFDDSDVPF